MNVKVTGDKVLKDAIAGLGEIEVGSGDIIGVNGRCSLLAAAAISEDLQKQYSTIAFWNPDRLAYIVAVSKNQDIQPGSVIGTDGRILPPIQSQNGNSYLINKENDYPDRATLLSIGFNSEVQASPDQTVVDALAAIDKLGLEPSTLVKLNGRANLPIIAALSDRLSDHNNEGSCAG